MRKVIGVVLGALVALTLFVGPAQAKPRVICVKWSDGRLICLTVPRQAPQTVSGKLPGGDRW